MKSPVLFVILQTGPLANGGLQSITEIMRRLAEFRPIVLTNLESAVSRSWRDLGFDVHVVPEEASAGLRQNPAGVLASYRRYHREVGQILTTSGAAIVHANDPLAFQLSLSAAKRAKARIVLNLRDTIDPGRKPPRLKFRMIFGAADHVFYLSADMADRWHAVAGNATRASSVTHSIVDPARFAPSAPSDERPPVVLVPGLISPKKGQLEFIRNVVPALAAREISTWLAGDFDPGANHYAAKCQAAAEPFADKVKFLGFRSDMPELLARASVVAVPSRHEGLMRGMIEAMSVGRPVVSFDVCSAREMLEQSSPPAGVVIPQGDYAGMADALIRFATDRQTQSAAGQAGSALARVLFNPAQVVERYQRVYRQLSRHG